MGLTHLISHEEELLLEGKLDDVLNALPALYLSWGDTASGDIMVLALGAPSPPTGWVPGG